VSHNLEPSEGIRWPNLWCRSDLFPTAIRCLYIWTHGVNGVLRN